MLRSVLLFTGLTFASASQLWSQARALPSLAGTWTLEVVDNINPDGTRVHLYGDDPQGILMFDAHGHYAIQIMRSHRPAFAANDRLRGTDAEVRALAEGINTHWGTYVVDSTGKLLRTVIQHASFPNWEGQARATPITLVGDRLTYTVATPTTGGPGVIGEVVWRRLW